MGGDDQAALGVLAAGSWIELLIAELVHLRPNAQARQHLVDLARHCQAALPPDDAGEGAEVLSLISNLIEVRFLIGETGRAVAGAESRVRRFRRCDPDWRGHVSIGLAVRPVVDLHVRPWPAESGQGLCATP